MSPYYMPMTSVEEVDGKQVLVIWCPAGINRPYSVPENVTAKNGSKEYFYIRSGTSSIIAKGIGADRRKKHWYSYYSECIEGKWLTSRCRCYGRRAHLLSYHHPLS